MFRHFLKRFAPGADRFADVDVVNNIATGGPVLSDSLAFLDCKVSSRLETPDHWIIYGIVKNGSVSDLSCKTAVHHRKVANHYWHEFWLNISTPLGITYWIKEYYILKIKRWNFCKLQYFY